MHYLLPFLLVFFASLGAASACETATLVDRPDRQLAWACAGAPSPFTGYLVDKLSFDELTKRAQLWGEFGPGLLELSDDAASLAQQNAEILSVIATSDKDARQGPGFLEYLGAGAVGVGVGVVLSVVIYLVTL